MKRILSTAALLVLATTANASVTLSGGTFLSKISGYNPAPSFTVPLSGLVNPTFNSDALDSFTATFLGKEAGHIDQFLVNGSVIFNNLIAAPSAEFGPFSTNGAPLTFAFRDSKDGGLAPNGGAFNFASYVVFGTQDGGVFTPATNGGYDFVLGFNDSSTVDGDYDDLVVGFNVTAAVPEPETYALMLAGLGVVAFMARRRRAD